MGRDVNLIEAVRKSAENERKSALWMPEGQRTYRTWPLCLTCGKEVDAVELKNVTAMSVELYARCHGKEDWTTIKFPYRIEGDPLENDEANVSVQHAMKAFEAFDPYRIIK